jgi:predicted CoA-binding protein
MKTLVIGASPEPSRYAYQAVLMLKKYDYEVIAFGKQKGAIDETDILTDWDAQWEVDTVTLYINPTIQRSYYDKIIALKPRRVIFNPGTENNDFYAKLESHGILHEVACTLVLLSIGEY